MDYDDVYPPMAPEEEEQSVRDEWEGREYEWLYADTWDDGWLEAVEEVLK